MITHMPDLYLNYFMLPVAARSEQYSIPLSIYMNKEDLQLVANDGMLISNHNFHWSTELVSSDF